MPGAEEKAELMKAKLEQERLEEENRQAADAEERKRIAEEVAQKRKADEDAVALETAAAAKSAAELEAKEKAGALEAAAAAKAAAELEAKEKAAKRQAALEQAEQEEEDRARRIADLALKTKAAKAAAPKIIEKEKQRPKQELTMAGMEDRLERQMSRTPALKSLIKWIQKCLSEALGLQKLKEDITAKAKDFDITKTAKALDNILVENPGNGLARIALGILCYSGCATSTTIPKSSASFVGSLFAVRLFYEFIAWKEDSADDADPADFVLAVENAAADENDDEEAVTGFDNVADDAGDPIRESATSFVQMLIKAYTTSGNPREENPNGVAYAYLGDAAAMRDVIMGKYGVLRSLHRDMKVKVKTVLDAAQTKVSPESKSAEQGELDEAQAAVLALRGKLAATEKELAQADIRQQKAKTEADAQKKKQGAAKIDLRTLLKDKQKIQAYFAAADKDGDGMLSLEEAKMQGMDEATFRAIDADGNGQLTQEEFAKWSGTTTTTTTPAAAAAAATTTALGAALGGAGQKVGNETNDSSSDDDSDFDVEAPLPKPPKLQKGVDDNSDEDEVVTGFATEEHAF